MWNFSTTQILQSLVKRLVFGYADYDRRIIRSAVDKWHWHWQK